jgi:hypothetical protein
LKFSAKTIKDGRISPLRKCKSLQYIDFSTNLFAVDQIAWLRSKCLDLKYSRVLQSHIKLEKGIERGDKTLDILVVGKRMPFLNSRIDKIKLEKYIERFDNMVQHYINNPLDLPDE